MTAGPRIRTPDQRLRVFVSSTLGELAEERTAVRRAIEQLRLSPVMFELGARPHPPRELYRAYLDQSDVFVGIYGESYGWIAPDEEISGLEDEYRLAGHRPRLMYLKEPAPNREPRLTTLLAQLQDDDRSTYRRFSTTEELEELVLNDLSLLLSERFVTASDPTTGVEVPVPLTETIGRVDDVDAVVAALRAGSRLVTLTGPGGVGKTRLALEVAGSLGDDFPGGVHFVPLAAITDPSLVVWELIDHLGARAEGSTTPAQALADRLRGPAALLVLDNLEQVAEAGADLAELLSRAPTVQIVATSRQALRVAGEQEHVVAPLAPDEAVALFLARARDVTPGYEPTGDDRAALDVLSRRLDGLPLAIELAAARTRLLPPAELLARLDDRFSLLSAPAGDRPERQRTLQATLDWSHDLLDDDERTLFAWLATFAGGWTLAAAEGVCEPSGVAVLDGLASLLDKSLVVAEPDERGSPRFRMFETVRAYARQQLEGRPDAEAARRAHLVWFCALGEEAQPFLCGPYQAEWMARVEPERANLRAAVATGLELGEHLLVVDLAWDVVVHYFVRDAVHEPYGWMCQVVAVQPDLDVVGQAKLRTLHGLLATFHGETAGAREGFEWSLEVFRSEEGLGLETAVAMKELAFVRYAEDADPTGAIADLEAADRLFEGLNHDWGQSLVQIMIGTLLAAEDDLEPAARHLELALDHAERIANDQLLAQGLGHLALVRCRQGEFAEAEQLVVRAAETVRRGRFGADAAACLDALAAILLSRDDPATAGRALAAAAEARRHIGATLWPTLEAYVQSLAAAASPVTPDEDEGAGAEGGDVFAALDRTLLTVVGSAV